MMKQQRRKNTHNRRKKKDGHQSSQLISLFLTPEQPHPAPSTPEIGEKGTGDAPRQFKIDSNSVGGNQAPRTTYCLLSYCRVAGWKLEGIESRGNRVDRGTAAHGHIQTVDGMLQGHG